MKSVPSLPLPSWELLMSVKGNLDGKKITENLDFVENFVENSNFTRESTDASFRGCFAVNSQEKNLRWSLILEKL